VKKDLQALRGRIDQLDGKIVRLLNERAKTVLGVKKIKEDGGLQVYAPHREMQVYRRLATLNKGPFPQESLEAVFREIMSAALSMEGRLKVSYFGQPGTNTHIAAMRKFGKSCDYCPGVGLADVFQEVERGRANYGVVPIENSTEGTVNHTLDLFVESDLKICSEIFMPITYTLMSKSGDKKRIKKVLSHPQSLAQCRLWLEGNLPGVSVMEAASTARAAQTAAQDPSVAAIAPELAAQIYHLKPIARSIEDMKDNYTRFLVIGNTECLPSGDDKTSIMVSIKDKVGALYHLLTPFHKLGINLINIESRPSRRKAWDYYFFIDFLGHQHDPKVKRVLAQVGDATNLVKVLGSYPRAKNESE
jgi:chorismate mutase/prephenate dehydratase